MPAVTRAGDPSGSSGLARSGFGAASELGDESVKSMKAGARPGDKSVGKIAVRRVGGKTVTGIGRKAGDAAGNETGAQTAGKKTGAEKALHQPGFERLDPDRDCDPVAEVAVLLDAIIHDLRTPLSAMSGWLEVLEAHFGEADGIVGRALQGLRRGVDSQAGGLNNLSDVLMKQRIDLPADGDCLLLERMQLALRQMDARRDLPVESPGSARLDPLRSFDAAGSLTCKDAGSGLNDACGTLLRALVAAQDAADGSLSITANANKILITVPGGSGDASALRSLCQGLAGYSARLPEIRPQALWLARSMLQRCGLTMQMSPAGGGGFNLLLSRVR